MQSSSDRAKKQPNYSSVLPLQINYNHKGLKQHLRRLSKVMGT